MSTHSIVGYVDREGFGKATYIHFDGYPTNGVGETLMRHWQDMDKVKILVEGGDMNVLAGISEIEKIEYCNDIDGFPTELTPNGQSFFEIDWRRKVSARYVYLLTPDGWFGKCLLPYRDNEVKPIPHMMEG